MDINKSITTFTNILKLKRSPKKDDEWWWETGDRKGTANADSKKIKDEGYTRPGYSYPRTKGGGTYGVDDAWAMANWDGRFKGNNKIKNKKWADAAKIMWAKINSSGRKPGYDRVTGNKDTDAQGSSKKIGVGSTVHDQVVDKVKRSKTKYTPKSNKTASSKTAKKKLHLKTEKSMLKTDYTGAQKRASERKTLNAMRRKSTDMNSYEELKGFWKDKSDTYIKRKPVALNVEKDHAIVPPRQGNMWDAVKHRWVSPDNYGKNVTDVQGKAYRSRAGGAGGQGKKSIGGHMGGVARAVTSGRRHRHFSDTGARSAHENIRTKAGKIQRTIRTARRPKTKG